MKIMLCHTMRIMIYLRQQLRQEYLEDPILGFLSYYSQIKQQIKLNTNSNYGFEFLILAPFPLIVYFVDLNLNFPSYRPFNLYLLLSYIIILYNSNQKVNERS